MYYKKHFNWQKHQEDKRYTIPVRFLVENKERLNLLYLYLRLRCAAIDHAGYVPDSVNKQLTHNERYRLIPELIRIGWMTSSKKLVSVQRILEKEYPNEHLNNVHTQMSYYFLIDKITLKSYIFSLVEQYILQGKYRAENYGYKSIDRDTKTLTRQHINKSKRGDLFKTQRMSLEPQGGLCKNMTEEELPFRTLLSVKYIGDTQSGCVSRISYSMLKEWGYSERSTARLRKTSLNQYGQRTHIHSDEEGKSFYSKKLKAKIKYLPVLVGTPLNNIYYCNFTKRRGKYIPYSPERFASKMDFIKYLLQSLSTRKELILKNFSQLRRSILDQLKEKHPNKTLTTIKKTYKPYFQPIPTSTPTPVSTDNPNNNHRNRHLHRHLPDPSISAFQALLPKNSRYIPYSTDYYTTEVPKPLKDITVKV